MRKESSIWFVLNDLLRVNKTVDELSNMTFNGKVSSFAISLWTIQEFRRDYSTFVTFSVCLYLLTQFWEGRSSNMTPLHEH